VGSSSATSPSDASSLAVSSSKAQNPAWVEKLSSHSYSSFSSIITLFSMTCPTNVIGHEIMGKKYGCKGSLKRTDPSYSICTGNI
jgi:hypothetical protein